MVSRRLWFVTLFLAAPLAACGPGYAGAPAPAGESETDLIARARGIHERVIALDTHNDINPANFTPDRNYTQRLDTQVNLPKIMDQVQEAARRRQANS